MNWISLNPKSIDQETDSVLWRNQIEQRYFKIKFFEELHPSLGKKLSDPKYYDIEENVFNLKKAKTEMGTYRRILNTRRQSINHLQGPSRGGEDIELFSVHTFKKSKTIEDEYDTKLVLREIGLFSTIH